MISKSVLIDVLTWCIRVRTFVTFPNDENFFFLANVSSLFVQLEEDKNSHDKNNMRVCIGTVLVMVLLMTFTCRNEVSFVSDDRWRFVVCIKMFYQHIYPLQKNFTCHAKKQSYTSQKLNDTNAREKWGEQYVNECWVQSWTGFWNICFKLNCGGNKSKKWFLCKSIVQRHKE